MDADTNLVLVRATLCDIESDTVFKVALTNRMDSLVKSDILFMISLPKKTDCPIDTAMERERDLPSTSRTDDGVDTDITLDADFCKEAVWFHRTDIALDSDSRSTSEIN